MSIDINGLLNLVVGSMIVGALCLGIGIFIGWTMRDKQ